MTRRRHRTNPFLLFSDPACTMRDIERNGEDVLDTLEQVGDTDDEELDRDLMNALLPEDE
jgi:hypothetical protein